MKLTSIFVSLIFLFSFSGCSVNRESTPRQPAPAAATPQPTVAISNTSSATNSLPDVQPALQKNLLAFGAGTMMVSSTSESKGVGETARCLIDESPFMWITAEGQIENQSVTLD